MKLSYEELVKRFPLLAKNAKDVDKTHEFEVEFVYEFGLVCPNPREEAKHKMIFVWPGLNFLEEYAKE